MKNFKKIASVVLALIMVFALTSVAFAEGETGTITINNAKVGQTYTAYKIFDLESYKITNAETEEGNYAYKVDSKWKAFVTGSGAGASYVTVDENDYVTWVEGADAADFAKLALVYAGQHKDDADVNTKITPAATPVTATGTTVTFTDLPLGYYLVDSTLGILCSLNTTNPVAEIEEKNDEPTVDKAVSSEDLENDSDEWTESNDVNVGDTVYYKVEIDAKKGAQNYVLHDKMDSGLTLNNSSIEVYLNDNTTSVAATNYVVKIKARAEDADDFTDACANCTFHVKFTQTFLDTLDDDDTIIVRYSAVLNQDAVVEGEGNPNEVYLKYGDDNETTHDEVRTYTWLFDLEKYTENNDNEKVLLPGAEFELYAEGSTTPIRFHVTGTTYKVCKDATCNDTAEGVTPVLKHETTLKPDQIIKIEGLDAGTYTLKETKAPTGYNAAADTTIVITAQQSADKETMTLTKVEVNGTEIDKIPETTETAQDGNVVSIINKTGQLLPSTGGIGTTIFYIVGGLLLVAALVLLVTRRRMSTAK